VLNVLLVKTVVAFGETLWDLLPTGPVLGGAPANCAYRINSLGDRGLIVTRLGKDDLGRKAFEALKALGMDTSRVQWDEGRPTGTVPVTIDANGVPDYTIVRDVAYDAIEPVEVAADAVCFGTLVQRSPHSRRALHRLLASLPSALKYFDINLRRSCFTAGTVAGSLERADILKLNEDEAFQLRSFFGLRGKTPAAIAREARGRWGLEAVILTRGERGAVAVTAREEVEMAGWKVVVSDTIGSGDAFSAAFLHCWMGGRSLEDCCFFGNVLGAMVARTPGATAPITLDEIYRFCGRNI
jgi:fructokinase